ncbi:MAG: hypothetical protein PHS40_09595 [Mariniphaga sp.]|nr:hypothetical protein [Mariniphaga sp.]
MEKYIQQLIEDLQAVAKNPPKPSYIEPPPYLEDDSVISELALVPFKTIEELTGIKQEVFPEINDLQGDQWERVNQAIFKIFESLNIELIDAPPEMPPEWLYEVLTTNWQHPVQYLPSSGMDLELCTGDPMTCPYGDYCDCCGEWEEIEDAIPERFEKHITEIADSIDAGLICYLNPETLEMEDIPQMLMNDPEEFEAITTGTHQEDEEFQHEKWDEYYKFEPLESHESFQIMESFADSLKNESLQNQLYYALNHSRPFANFKAIIQNSKERQNWFNFKKEFLKQHVRRLIRDEINKIASDLSDEINGLFNDDGIKIDPETVPLPSLCIICKHYYTDDPEENILCLLNRHDQRDEEDFKCGSFEKI